MNALLGINKHFLIPMKRLCALSWSTQMEETSKYIQSIHSENYHLQEEKPSMGNIKLSMENDQTNHNSSFCPTLNENYT